MFKVINIMTGVTVAAYPDTSDGAIAQNMERILNQHVPPDVHDDSPFKKIYVAIDTSVADVHHE